MIEPTATSLAVTAGVSLLAGAGLGELLARSAPERRRLLGGVAFLAAIGFALVGVDAYALLSDAVARTGDIELSLLYAVARQIAVFGLLLGMAGVLVHRVRGVQIGLLAANLFLGMPVLLAVWYASGASQVSA